MEPVRVLNIFGILDVGGAETFIMNVYRNIDRTKVQFDFLVYDSKVGAYEEEILKLGGKIFRAPRFGLKNLFAYNKFMKEFLKEHREYKVIHCHLSELGCIAFRHAKKAGIPYRICHAHSAPTESGIKYIVRYLFRRMMNYYSTERLSCGDVAGKWLYGKSKFKTITNGIQVEKYTYDLQLREKLREQYSLENSFVVGHVGRFEAPKNHSYLLRIFAEVVKRREDAKLVLLGDGSLRSELEKDIKELSIENECLLLGVKDNIPELMQMMDVFVFPSVYEGLGIALIEAQASGLPCFASTGVPKEADVTGMVEFLSCEEEPKVWADRILKSEIERTDKTKDVIAAGYDIVESAKFLQNYYEECYKS